ncbi:MAG: FYDLN acid domain-containing protein [Hyphomicrobiaceae bacterium]
MPNRSVRGEKRKCQNEECEALFYDLNREEFDCPICGIAFDHAAHASALAKQREDVPDYIRRRQAQALPIVATTDATEESSDADEAVVDESSDSEDAAEDETTVAESPDVLLDEDEDAENPLTDAVPKPVSDDQEQ